MHSYKNDVKSRLAADQETVVDLSDLESPLVSQETRIKYSGKRLYELRWYERKELLESIAKSGQWHAWNFSASMGLILHKDLILAKFFFDGNNLPDCSKIIRRQIASGKLKDWSYETQTDDVPEGLTRQEYRKRGKIWEKIIERNSLGLSAWNTLGFYHDFMSHLTDILAS